MLFVISLLFVDIFAYLVFEGVEANDVVRQEQLELVRLQVLLCSTLRLFLAVKPKIRFLMECEFLPHKSCIFNRCERS